MLYSNYFLNRGSLILTVALNLHFLVLGTIQDNEYRYQALSAILDLYRRPITVLDIGASQGYFSFKIAREYDSTCVMLENEHNPKNLLEQCQFENLENIILLKKKITIEDLERLASCEHFDVVLALNIINHFKNQWERAADAILCLSDNIIIETSARFPDLENYLIAQQCSVMREIANIDPWEKSKLFWCKRQKKILDRHHWLGKKGFSSDYLITSNFYEKNIYKQKEHKTHNWIPGINLLTFKMLNGIWPSKNSIKAQIKQMSGIAHEDLMIWNMIIQGISIVPIDYTIASGNPFNSDLCLLFALGMVEQDTSDNVIQWFKNNWPLFTASQGRTIPLKFFDLKIQNQ